MRITQILEFFDREGQQNKSLQLGCKVFKLRQVIIDFAEICRKGLLFGLGQHYSVAHLAKVIYGIPQCI